MAFSKDFAWGVSTAAYQIEGGAFEGDKGLNVWDVGSMTEDGFSKGTGEMSAAITSTVSARTSRS